MLNDYDNKKKKCLELLQKPHKTGTIAQVRILPIDTNSGVVGQVVRNRCLQACTEKSSIQSSLHDHVSLC